MPVDMAEIERLRRQLAEKEEQLLRENGLRFEIIRRLIAQDEWQRIMDSLETMEERRLFGLEPLEEPKRRGRPPGGAKAAKSGGNLECEICHEGGFTERGLKVHRARRHKDVQAAVEATGEGTEP